MIWIDVYRRHKDQLFCIALAVTGRRELAEDAVHDAFVSLCSRRRRVRDPKTYAFQAVRNSARMIVRKRQRAGEPGSAGELQDDLAICDPGAIFAEHNETIDELKRALASLSEAESEVIVMHIYAELTFQEVAAVLDRPMGTVASQYRRGIERIRATLNKPNLSKTH
jgi:RNA polymerase sigma-70 factor (ECF subfamily)